MEWTCEACGAVNDEDVGCCGKCAALRPGPSVVSDTQAVPARDLRAESHVRAVAWWRQADGAVLGMSALLMLLAFVVTPPDEQDPAALPLIGATAALAIGHYALGHYLARFEPWARWVALAREIWDLANVFGVHVAFSFLLRSAAPDGREALVALLVLLLNVGLLLLIAFRIWLFAAPGARLFTAEYRASVEANPRQHRSILRSPFFWLPWVGIALVLTILYLMSR